MTDQCFYSAELLLRRIDCLWDSSYTMRSTVDLDGPKAPRDPGRMPDLPLEVADIRRAWRRSHLSSQERQIFICKYLWELPLDAIGTLYGLDVNEVADVLDVVVAEMLAQLNGGAR